MKPNPSVGFIPECHADTLLLSFLKVPVKQMNHAYGISKVAKAMESQRENFHKVLVGLIDQDKKNTPRYFDDFIEEKSAHGVLLRKKPTANHYLLTLCPEMEQWLIDSAASVGIKPSRFNLPDDPKELHNITQQVSIGKNQDFLEFLQAIKKQKAPSFLNLQTWLNDFCTLNVSP